MSKQLEELLFTIRQHPAFRELLDGVHTQPIIGYRQGGDEPQKQFADFVFRSGRRHQHEIWRQFLIGEVASQQEKL